MSTRCAIAMKLPDGSVRAIYCHHDGYVGGVGTILAGWYAVPEQVEALLALGDLSSLGITLTDGTIAYHRDRGECLKPAQCYPDVKAFLAKGMVDFDADYLYLHVDGEWLVHGLRHEPEWVKINVIAGGNNHA